ncbi:HNH endonuclease, partial [Glycomyces sp. L485]|uniref:HNH endonuclease signature motif containing protein n=1 Tax=Glycomyces sp. L485 TaxID=2909235 RepID=UPI001F4AE462|nr:HNH endonuclease [Glycomyces sp. L485]
MHWANGGPTTAQNLILLCRFHHGRVHTPGWDITKTGPGKALIVHHEGHDDSDLDLKCGCADWRTDEDLEIDFADDIANIFPTGLYPDEYGPGLREDLDRIAEALEQERLNAEMKEARARLRKKYAAPNPTPTPASQAGGESECNTGPERGTEQSSAPGSGPGGRSRPEDEHASAPSTPPAAAPAEPAVQVAAMRLVHPKTNEPLIPVR